MFSLLEKYEKLCINNVKSSMNQHEKTLKLKQYKIIESNGQRIYSPSDCNIPPPPKGSEIFIGNLAPDLYENEIFPLFVQIGPIYNLRIMLDFCGRTRGYAFLSYFCQEHAEAAVRTFNNYHIRPATRICVGISVDNRRLFVGHLPRDKTVEEIKSVLEKFVEGIIDIIMLKEPFDKNLNRGYVFIEFESHRLAAIARRKLGPGNVEIWGNSIFVDWADPLPTVSSDKLKQVTKLYISNLPCEMNTEELKSILYGLVGHNSILRVHKITDYAFVHLVSRKLAEEAFAKMQRIFIKGQYIKVEWARPIEYSKTQRLATIPDNYCKSVPPIMRRIVREIKSKKNDKNGDSKDKIPPSNFDIGFWKIDDDYNGDSDGLMKF